MNMRLSLVSLAINKATMKAVIDKVIFVSNASSIERHTKH